MENNGYVADDNGKVFTVSRYESTGSLGTAISENLVKINSRGPLYRNPTFYKRLSIILCVLFLILLSALIAISCLYIGVKKPVKICNSPECLRSAANLKLSMDANVDPCYDFYQFSCGHWTEEHPNHGWYPKFSNFETLEERISIATLKFLESESSDREPLPVKQCRDFFHSCMDVDSIDRVGYKLIYKYLDMVNLSMVPHLLDVKKRDDSFSFDWLKTEVVIKKMFYMDIFIGFTVDSNMYERSNYSMYIGTPGNMCPLPSALRNDVLHKKIVAASENETDDSNDERKEAHRRVFKRVVLELFKNVSYEVPGEEIMDSAFDIISNLTEEIEALYQNETTDEYIGNEYTLKELQNITDEYLITHNEKPVPVWNQYLSYLFEDVNISLALDGTDRLFIDVDELPYLPRIIYYLLKTPDAYLELYMWWLTIYAMIMNTTTEIAEYISKEAEPFASNGNVIRSRSLDCAGLVTNFMGMAVSYGIADKAFLNSTKPKVQQMLLEIKEAFVQRVNELSWMDRQTKLATLNKSKYMTSFIGFPEWLFESGSLEYYYEGVVIKPNSYFENMMVFVKSYMPHKLSLLAKKNRRTWRTDPTTVNAYNYFSDNSINVPMAILSYPVYHLGLEVLHYGAMGSILGHELTHGFDNTGRKYDQYGSYNQWWSNHTTQAFENLTECFIKQYENYTVPYVDGHVHGKQTLGENLADNGGLHHAYLAYQRYVRKYGAEPHLPGFEDYSSSQMFFIAFGNIWCESAPSKQIMYQLETDEHCPNSIRVLGTLQNSHEFSAAFNCPVGSRMNPNRTRCRIW